AGIGAQMRRGRDWFTVLPLPEAIERLRTGALPSRAAAITFDDGYADNCTVAMPILSRLRLPATFFVATGFLDGGRMWNDTVIESVRRAGDELDLSSLGLGHYSLPDATARRRAFAAILPALKYRGPHQPIAQASAGAERVTQG